MEAECETFLDESKLQRIDHSVVYDMIEAIADRDADTNWGGGVVLCGECMILLCR